jgi:GNAT superfamily N-acetyltransferase
MGRTARSNTLPTSFQQTLIPEADLQRVFGRLQFLEADYPDFDGWYWNTVVPEARHGEIRRIHFVERDQQIAGVYIAKRSLTERKLCNVWVAPEWERSGMGVRLMLDAMQWMGTSTPLASVSEARMPQFADIMTRLGYVLTQVLDGYYRPGSREFVYNGALRLDA